MVSCTYPFLESIWAIWPLDLVLVSKRPSRFLWVPKVTWSILSACFLLGLGSNLAGVSVFSNLTLTRLWAAIVRNPRFPACCYMCVSNGFLLGRGSTAAGVRVFRNRSFVFYGMGSKGDVKHSVCVFFTWHGLESCWCFGLYESDADETLSSHRSESTFLLVVICAFGTVFCLAEARLLLAFGCFGTEALFFMAWVPKVTWSILSACFLLGMGSNLAGVSVFSNLTLTRLWAAIVRNPRSCLWLYVRFERFFAWQRPWSSNTSYLVPVLFKQYYLSNVGPQNQSLFKQCNLSNVKNSKSGNISKSGN